MNVRLVVVQGRPQGMEIPLPMPQFLIGRDPRCQLRPSNELISKLHCAILQRKEGVFIRDLKSTNGTFVNNDRIEGEVALHDGDLLKIGPLVFAIKIPVAKEAAPGRQSGDAEDQAVSWLLDYRAGAEGRSHEDMASKTTILDMGNQSQTSATPTETEKPLVDTKTDVTPPKGSEAPKTRAATAELASDILDRLLSPPRKKKR